MKFIDKIVLNHLQIIEDREMMLAMMMQNPQLRAGMMQSNDEEEKQLQRAIEESNQQNPNPDSMTYEQLLELGDRLGKVNKGLTKQQIAKIPAKYWRSNSTK